MTRASINQWPKAAGSVEPLGDVTEKTAPAPEVSLPSAICAVFLVMSSWIWAVSTSPGDTVMQTTLYAPVSVSSQYGKIWRTSDPKEDITRHWTPSLIAEILSARAMN